MKFNRLFIVLLLIAVLLLAAGCRRDTSGPSGNVEQIRASSFWPYGFAAVQNTPVYFLVDGVAVWANSLDFGEPLILNSTEIGKLIPSGKYVNFNPVRVAIDDRDAYLIPVAWKEFGVWLDVNNYAAANSQVGTATKTFTAGGETFKAGELVVFSELNKANTTAPYSVPLNTSIIQNFISFNAEDVEAAKLLAKARTERNSERAATLLREAAEQYPSSVLLPLISEMLDSQGRVGTAREHIIAPFSTAQENTAVYYAPDFSSAVVKRLEQYTDVKTAERTTETATSRAGSARWYRISEPAEGWIFGLDLEGAD